MTEFGSLKNLLIAMGIVFTLTAGLASLVVAVVLTVMHYST